jgi:hypothetical protein
MLSGYPFTVTARFLSKTNGLAQTMFSQKIASSSIWIRLVVRAADDATYFEIFNNPTISSVASSTYMLPNQWNTIAAVATDTSINLYFNGQQYSATNVVTFTWGSFTESRIGMLLNFGQYLNGSIDDVRIYNRALSAQEIAAIYNETKRKPIYTDGGQ